MNAKRMVGRARLEQTTQLRAASFPLGSCCFGTGVQFVVGHMDSSAQIPIQTFFSLVAVCVRRPNRLGMQTSMQQWKGLNLLIRRHRVPSSVQLDYKDLGTCFFRSTL